MVFFTVAIIIVAIVGATLVVLLGEVTGMIFLLLVILGMTVGIFAIIAAVFPKFLTVIYLAYKGLKGIEQKRYNDLEFKNY